MDNDSPAVRPAEPSPERPLVSAVVVAGDAGASIGRALASIIGQTLPPDRVLVVIAGSRDGTFATARTWNGRHDHADPGPGPASTTVTVIDRGPREDSLRSAYDFAFRLVRDSGLVLLVAPDADLEERVLELLAAELDRDPGLTMAAARLEPRPSGPRRPLAGALRLLQRHWAVGAVETGTELGITGPVPLAPATLVRLPALGATASASEEGEGGAAGGDPDVLSTLLAGDGRASIVPEARARVDTAVTWGTLRDRRDGWGAYVRRHADAGASRDPGDRRRARLAGLRITVGPVLRVVAFALILAYVAAAGIQGTLHPQWWWALPVVVRLPLQLRTMRRIRERSAADVVFGATHLPLELGEMAYGVSRIRAAVRRVGPRALRPPAVAGTTPPATPTDLGLLGVLGLLVAVVLGLAAEGGPIGGGLTTAVGWLACIVTAADLVTALLRLLARRPDRMRRGRRTGA